MLCHSRCDTEPNKSPFPTTELHRSLENTISRCSLRQSNSLFHHPRQRTSQKSPYEDQQHRCLPSHCQFLSWYPNAFPSFTKPPTGIDCQSVDTLPPINNSFPINCQFIVCQLHHLGIKKHPSPNTDHSTLIPILEKHRLTFHSNLLQTLPANMINSIGWFWCTACLHIAFTAQNLTTHHSTCTLFQKSLFAPEPDNQHNQRSTKQPMPPPTKQPTPPSTPPQTTTNSHTSIPDAVVTHLIAVCPAKHLQHLQNLVDSDTDLTTLLQTLIDWIVETTTQTTEANNKKHE